MSESLAAYADAHGITYFLISFTDLLGVQRAKLVPAAVVDRMAAGQAGFAGFAAWLDMTPADADVLAVGDRQRVFPLPWKPEVAWMPANLLQGDNTPPQANPPLGATTGASAGGRLGLSSAHGC